MRDHDRFDGKAILPSNFYLDAFYRNFPVWQKGLFDFSVQKGLFDLRDFDFENVQDAIRKAVKIEPKS